LIVSKIYFKEEEYEPRKIILRFVDAMIYAPGYTLDQFTQDYSDKKISQLE
jgi:hypothetical protein